MLIGRVFHEDDTVGVSSYPPGRSIRTAENCAKISDGIGCIVILKGQHTSWDDSHFKFIIKLNR